MDGALQFVRLNTSGRGRVAEDLSLPDLHLTNP